MKIVYVSDAIYPYNKGGKEKRFFELTTRLASMNHEVHIYCMKWWEGPKDRVENGVHLHGICKLYPLYKGERRSIKEGILFALACLKLICVDFDVVDVDHMPFFPLYTVWLVCLLKRKKMFATWNEVWGRKYWVEYMGWAGNISALVEQLSMLLPAKITSISSHTSAQLRNQLHYKKEIALVPAGLNYTQIGNIKPAHTRSDVIYTGRLLKHKRVDLIICAVAELKKAGQDIQCVIVGEGPEKDNLQELARKLDVVGTVKFHSFYENHDDVLSLIKASKVFAFPSEREGFGMVVIEANACGKPVITSDAPANASRELIQFGKNGSVVPLDAQRIADAISYWIGNKDDGIADDASQYDWDNLAIKQAGAYAS